MFLSVAAFLLRCLLICRVFHKSKGTVSITVFLASHTISFHLPGQRVSLSFTAGARAPARRWVCDPPAGLAQACSQALSGRLTVSPATCSDTQEQGEGLGGRGGGLPGAGGRGS